MGRGECDEKAKRKENQVIDIESFNEDEQMNVKAISFNFFF